MATATMTVPDTPMPHTSQYAYTPSSRLLGNAPLQPSTHTKHTSIPPYFHIASDKDIKHEFGHAVARDPPHTMYQPEQKEARAGKFVLRQTESAIRKNCRRLIAPKAELLLRPVATGRG